MTGKSTLIFKRGVYWVFFAGGIITVTLPFRKKGGRTSKPGRQKKKKEEG